MTRKDYELIAATIASLRDSGGAGREFTTRTVDTTAHRFADALAAENGRFNRARFLRACGVEA